MADEWADPLGGTEETAGFAQMPQARRDDDAPMYSYGMFVSTARIPRYRFVSWETDESLEERTRWREGIESGEVRYVYPPSPTFSRLHLAVRSNPRKTKCGMNIPSACAMEFHTDDWRFPISEFPVLPAFESVIISSYDGYCSECLDDLGTQD